MLRYCLFICAVMFSLSAGCLQAQLPGWRGALYFEVNNGSNTEDLVDYQIRFTFNHKTLVDRGDSKADGSDLRVSDCKGNKMHFWIERGKNSTGAVVWVKVPFLAARARDIVMLSYGKANTMPVEDPDSVFDFFDDFEDLGITQTKWARAQNATIAAGWVKPFRENTDWGGTDYMYCNKNMSYLGNRGIVECEVRSRKDNVGGNIIFYVNDPKTPNHYMIQHDTRFLNNTDGDFGFRAATNSGEVLPRYVYKWDNNERVFYQIKIIAKNNLYHYRYSNTSSNRRISGSIYPASGWNWNHIGLSAMGIYDYSFEVSYIWIRKYTPVEPSVYAKDMKVMTSAPATADFGRLVCESDREITLNIRNIGSDKVNISGHQFVKGVYSKYETNGVDTLKFNPGEMKEIKVRFFGKLAGRYEDTLILENDNPCAANLVVPLLALKDSVYIATGGLVMDTLDMGHVCPGRAVDSAFIIINKSNIPTFIKGSQLDTIFLYKGNNPFLDPMEINEERRVRITFSGSATEGVFYDSLTIIDTCGREKKVYLKVSVAVPVFDISSGEIDFGDITMPCDSAKTIDLSITNNSPYNIPGIINSIELKGQFGQNGIGSVDITSGDTIPAHGSKTFRIIFQPQKPGEYEGELHIAIEPCAVTKIIKLRANVPYVRFEGLRDGIDYGLIRTNSYKDSIIVFENTGTAAISVEKATGIAPPFEIVSVSPPLPATLNPGDSIRVAVRYNSADTLEHTCLLSLGGMPCSFAESVILKGKGLPIIAEALIYIPNTHANAGEKIIIPLILESSNNLVQSGIDAFEATVEMNRTLLKPTGIPESNNIIDGGKRRINLSGVWNLPDGILYNMEFTAALGDSVCTDMKITRFRWLNGLSKVSLISGRFCLVDVCYEGGPRLFEDSNELSLAAVQSPVTGMLQIRYGVIEEGVAKLRLYGLQGNKIADIYDGYTKAGSYEAEFDAGNLTRGLYFILLETPSQSRAAKVLIAN